MGVRVLPRPWKRRSITGGEDFRWEAYKFKAYERYLFDYRELLEGETHRGKVEILIEKEGKAFRLTFRGSYRRWSGSVSRTFSTAQEVAGWILMRMFFDHYWLIPLGRTLFSRGLVRALTRQSIDWRLGRRKLEEGVVRIVRECTEAGMKGRLLELLRKGEVFLRLCVSPRASLPLYLYRKEGINVYEIRLLSYSNVK